MISLSNSGTKLFLQSHKKSFMMLLLFLSLVILFPSITNAAFEFETRTGHKVSIEEVKREEDIDKDKAKKVLADSFISEYKSYCTPDEIDPVLKFWHLEQGSPSVEEYYHNYFHDEFSEFQKGHLHWVEAKIDGELVGWATFEEENSVNEKSLYMNLLVVSPMAQKKGIGEQLVLSLKHLGVCPDIDFIHLLLRKKNKGGRVFYTKLGFKFNPSYSRADNFVDMSLLEPWSLQLQK